jgi:hypothetical protein
VLISSVSDLFSIFEKGFAIRGYVPAKIGSFRLLARRPLISETSAPQIAFLFLKNAHYRYYRGHLSGFCGFFCDFISFRSYAKGCIDDFDQTGLM